MADPFTFNPLHIRCDEVQGTAREGGGGSWSMSFRYEVWFYPLPNGERLEYSGGSGFTWSAGGGGAGGGSSAPKKGYEPDFLKDHRLLRLQQMHAAWVAGLSAHARLAISAAKGGAQ